MSKTTFSDLTIWNFTVKLTKFLWTKLLQPSKSVVQWVNELGNSRLTTASSNKLR